MSLDSIEELNIKAMRTYFVVNGCIVPVEEYTPQEQD